MLPVGYLFKHVALRPEWIPASHVEDIYSLASCISDNFADYINYWRHNGYWLFDSPTVIEVLAADNGIDLTGCTPFYYEVYEYEYDGKNWQEFAPEPSFDTDVQLPGEKYLAGYDVATFLAHTSPECSPLSCNGLAATQAVNQHCLFHTFDEAKSALENGVFLQSEPGPYRIFAVYTLAKNQETLQ